MRSTRTIKGRCHCGNIRYVLELPKRGEKIPVRACSCSFCLMHGGVYTSDPEGELELDIDDRSLLHEYRFGTQTADFYVCTGCGVVPVVTSEIAGNTYAVVNVNSFVGVERPGFDSEVTDFDGESVESRLQRRASKWIPRVRIKFG